MMIQCDNSMMIQWWFHESQMIIQWWLNDSSMTIQWHRNDNSMNIQNSPDPSPNSYDQRDRPCSDPSLHSDPFTMVELQQALSKMKAGKAKDTAGIVAEMLTQGGTCLHEAILDLFNDILLPQAELPESWKKTRLVVLHKKGDRAMPKNYRPIAILPVLYKLFSRMLCVRIQDAILRDQSPDQAAYRKSFSTCDHLLALTLLLEKSKEWENEVWVCLVAFEKAFDTVAHEKLWATLWTMGVTENYTRLLQKPY